MTSRERKLFDSRQALIEENEDLADLLYQCARFLNQVDSPAARGYVDVLIRKLKPYGKIVEEPKR